LKPFAIFNRRSSSDSSDSCTIIETKSNDRNRNETANCLESMDEYTSVQKKENNQIDFYRTACVYRGNLPKIGEKGC